MKYYIIAGERSGDLHGSNLIRSIKEQDAEAEIRCWGGDEMQRAGGELVVHYREMAYMGFLEVIANLGTLLKRIKFCKKDIADYQPDALILIDYAGFNMRIAKFAHKANIPVHYYISPKIWAWNQGRAHKIKRFVNFMYAILPFEKQFYKKFDFEVDYVGNPLQDAIRQFIPAENFKANFPDKPIIAILPGSREQEVSVMLSKLSALIDDFTDYHFVVAGVSNLDKSLYQVIANHEHCGLVFDKAYDVLHLATAALVTSGTATLETALFEVPQVVCYQTSNVSYQIGKRVIKVDHISLVNLIMDREVVKELIQSDFNITNLKQELTKILPSGAKRATIKADYKALKDILGDDYTSKKTAELIVGRVAGY